jgi:tetratricopeptide (TPR) repeat protein
VKLKIKYSLYLLLLMAVPLFSRADDSTQTLFAKGNQQYAKAAYPDAVKTYQQILSSGYQSAVVYFNLGNAYYKLDDIPDALLYYEKAHKLAPGDADINFNIQLTNLKTADKVEQEPEFFVTKWWHGFILYFPVSTLAVLSILLLIAGFAVLILYLFTGSESVKKIAFYTGIVLIFAGLVSIFVTNRQAGYFDAHHQAIIFGSAVTVKASPDASAKPLFVVHEGTKVNLLQTNNGWIEIELPNGNAGWIAESDAKEI